MPYMYTCEMIKIIELVLACLVVEKCTAKKMNVVMKDPLQRLDCTT